MLQARAATTAQADKAGFEKACDACQKTFLSENSFRNHIGSSKHKARVAAISSRSNGNAKVDDETSSVMSSTFSLGEPAAKSEVVDSDAEEEFNEVVEGLKKTGLNERKSPVKRPSNPHLSAAAHRKEEHPVEISGDEASGPATPSADTTTGPKPDPSLKKCLFCNYESPTPTLSALHMERIHGMFIPEKQYLVDLEGLLRSLQERVFEFNECITCGKVKANTFAVQTHMRDKSHCQIPYTNEDEQLEIGEFYDFRSTYSDNEEDSEDDSTEDGKQNGGVKLGAKRDFKTTGDNDEEMEDDGWETDSSESSLDSNDLHAVPAENHYHQYERLAKHPHHSRDDKRAHHQRDGWHAHNHKRAHAVYYDDYELHLPSGRSVGHRSLNRYFRQNLHNYPTPEERAERLAIEAAEAENAMDVDDGEGANGNKGERQLIRKGDKTHGRSLINRQNRGLGVADPNELRKFVTKGRAMEFHGHKRRHVQESKRYFKEKHQNSASWSLSI